MAASDLTWFDILCRNAAERADRVAITFGRERFTHGDLLGRAERLAGGLARAGIRPGDRIAMVSQNRPEMIDVLGAASRLGAIVVPINWRLGAEELVANVADCTPRLVVAEEPYLPALAASDLDVVGFDGAGPGGKRFDELLLARWDAPAERGVASSDPFVIVHTAAVDGKPRGAVLTHGNLLAHGVQLGCAWGLRHEDVALCALPLFHVAGLGLVLAALQAGGSAVVMARFEASTAAEAIAAEGVTALFEFAPMLAQILDAADAGGRALGSLRNVWGLEAPEVVARFAAACPDAVFWAGFGQTETSGLVTMAPYGARPGSAGRALPLVRLAIVDEADGPAGTDVAGEIVVRGPTVFPGYWDRPAETADVSRDGWHRTGDLGRLDGDGFLFYAGRAPRKELIKTGGENVYPAEVERVLTTHPDVVDAMVFGVPDPRWGEAVRAVCVLRLGAAIEADFLSTFVGERIARYKRPRSVVFVDALPRDAAGGLDRARVKKEHGAA